MGIQTGILFSNPYNLYSFWQYNDSNFDETDSELREFLNRQYTNQEDEYELDNDLEEFAIFDYLLDD